MKEYKLQQTILVVEVPDKASDMQVGFFSHNLMYCDETGFIKSVVLPEGNWTILGKAFDLTVNDIVKIVDKIYVAGGIYNYKLYDKVGQYSGYPLKSWHSFLSTHSIKENNLILIKE